MLSRILKSVCVLLVLGTGAFAQTPVVSPRSAVNGITFTPALSSVGAGGILSVFGGDLADDFVLASAIPLPTALGGAQVLINGVAAPLFFASPGQINCQVPWDFLPAEGQPGAPVLELIIRRNGVDSAPAKIRIRAAQPNIFTLVPGGRGETIAQYTDFSFVRAERLPAVNEALVVFATGFGPYSTDGVNIIDVRSGEAGPGAPNFASTLREQRVWIGGIPATVIFSIASPQFVSLVQAAILYPEGARPGDPLQWYSGNRRANFSALGPRGAPEVTTIPIPASAANASQITASSLNGRFLGVSGVFDNSDFCFTEVQLVDMRDGGVTPIDGCVFPTDPDAGGAAQTAFLAPRGSANLALFMAEAAALSPEGTEQDSGVSTRVLVVNAVGARNDVQLAQSALRINGGGGGGAGAAAAAGVQTTRGNIRAVLPDPTAAINVNPWTFEQEVVETNAAVEFDTFSVDGLAVRASRLANFGDGDRAFVMVDKLPDPTQAVFAMVDSDAELETDAPYPDGWKPLIPSQIVLPPNRQNPAERFQGQQFSTFQMPAAADATAAYTFAENADGTQAAIVKLTAVELDALAQDKPSRKAHSFLTTSVIPLDGIFPMPCAAIQGLAQRASLVTDSIGFAASETLLRGPVREANGEFCVGGGVALLDSSTDAVSYYAAPGPIDARRGRFQVGSYMIYPNADHASTEPASKLYVFDMAAKTWRTIDNLDGAAGFTFNNNTVTVGNWLFALATDGPQNRSGNQGVLGIDIDKGTTRHYNSDGGRVFARGTRGSAIQFMCGYVIAKVQDPGVMPMTPQPPERITYWNFATKEKAVVELPEDAVFIARRQGPGQNVVNAWTVSQESMCISAVLFDREAAKYLQTVCFPGYR